MLKVVQDKPMVVRLLDPPMHEFLPHEKNDIQLLAKQLQRFPVTIAKQIERLQETNPMLGHRGLSLRCDPTTNIQNASYSLIY